MYSSRPPARRATRSSIWSVSATREPTFSLRNLWQSWNYFLVRSVSFGVCWRRGSRPIFLSIVSYCFCCLQVPTLLPGQCFPPPPSTQAFSHNSQSVLSSLPSIRYGSTSYCTWHHMILTWHHMISHDITWSSHDITWSSNICITVADSHDLMCTVITDITWPLLHHMTSHDSRWIW